MTQVLLTPTIVAKEALIALENNMVLGGLVYHGYSKEFANVGATVQIRKPTSFTASAWASTIAVQEASEATVSVVLDTLFDVSFEVGSQEMAHDVVDFSEQFIQPAMRAHAQAVDASLAALYADIGGSYPVTGTPVVSDIAGVEAVLDALKAPLSGRSLVLAPYTKSAYMSIDAFINAEKRADGGKALRTAEIGRVLGFDTYMDQNMPRHTATTTEATALVNGALAVAATTMVFDNHNVTAGTVTAGDVFWVKGYDQWMLAVGGTWASNAGTVIFSPPLSGTIGEDEVIQFYGGHRASLAFHKNAFALVTAPLPPPMGGAKGAVLNYKGISCRVVFDYNSSTKKNQISIDQLIGVKTLDPNLAARLMDGRNMT